MKIVLNAQNSTEAEIAKYYIGKEIDRRKEFYWRTKSGKEIKLEDMTLDHLYNTYKMLERHIEESKIIQENYLDAQG